MTRHHSAPRNLPRAQLYAERAFATLERFLHVEAVSGAVLLAAAAIALVWANSAFAHSYHALWHAPLSFRLGSYEFAQPLHFWINDALMTLFFLAVGMEIRREIHEGALSNFRQAALPLAAALGGVVAPALIYLAFNGQAPRSAGWAVPTATDIAFAVGVLALLGRAIPGNVRIFLLALAIIDDIIAVLIIAFFYSGGLDYSGFAVAALGIAIVLGLQRIGIGTAYAYVLPGAIVWTGLLMTGAHPTLAGVVLGLMTPVVPRRMREQPLEMMSRATRELAGWYQAQPAAESGAPTLPLRQLRVAQREILPPVVRVQAALHPWVAYAIMPLFALANAGVSLDGVDLAAGGSHWVMAGVAGALIVGKPAGVIAMSWLLVRLGWCRLPPGVTWGGIVLIGLLAGVGFTMSIFIAMLAFAGDANMLGAAKLGVLLGSLATAMLGLAWGAIYARRLRGASATRGTAQAPDSAHS
ncbi:Na+/H+ antiporter NhaA [Bordetella petrii]|uniref:Na(+)/H(+) antiporter NhaA n=1 Tax=Bordetella petrii (strain ATCC BAA-461 / DSM 12804 / CCUG 43448 / CIP 107267 / Se-1111R) TaxID=340100 RepID=NHAA_BORPD|nr:Na+/H+ antiporter NhaA [Bordetella petrii]A9IMX7.1 RecName: Full=Na(+)/H(+) antiporter NhaA; AltName: Full=Sodium/proton antiporter NhaA [Bordetella petrii DSM 12804]CAP42763.1 Na(+)/H(+) antiporter 1 [Bordetella petrii]